MFRSLFQPQNFFFQVRKMAKEQEDYVKKQEARKARGRQNRQTDDVRGFMFTDFDNGTHEKVFANFFAVSDALA